MFCVHNFLVYNYIIFYYLTEIGLEDFAISTVNNTAASTLSLLDSNTEMDSMNKMKKKIEAKEETSEIIG